MPLKARKEQSKETFQLQGPELGWVLALRGGSVERSSGCRWWASVCPGPGQLLRLHWSEFLPP